MPNSIINAARKASQVGKRILKPITEAEKLGISKSLRSDTRAGVIKRRTSLEVLLFFFKYFDDFIKYNITLYMFLDKIQLLLHL